MNETAGEYLDRLEGNHDKVTKLEAEIKILESACERWVEAEKEWEMTKGVLEAAIEAKEEVHREDFATAQAQVAVMATELECIANITEDGNSLTVKDVDAIRTLAASAAPKVVHLGKLPVWRGRNRSPGMAYAKGVGVPDLPHRLLDKELTVIVLDKGEGE